MKTVKFSDILTQTCQLVGLDIDTLNTKSFNVIRDLTSRRLSQIWDREQWPDTVRSLNTFPGLPVTSVEYVPQYILLEDLLGFLVDENGDYLWTQTSDNKLPLDVYFENTFPSIYLADFSGDAYKQGKVEETKVSFLNPFYLTLPDGTVESVSKSQYTFTYTEGTGTDQPNNGKGPRIGSIQINVPFSSLTSPLTSETNGALTPTVVFESNKQLLIQLDKISLQGIEVYSGNPLQTTRLIVENFVVEDYDDIDVSGNKVSNEYSYIRVYNAGEKFIRYRIPCIVLSGNNYNSNTLYEVGDKVYYNGRFWIAINYSSVGNPPESGSGLWEEIAIPYRFKDFLINGTACDFLRSEGRFEEAEVLNNMSEVAIQQQIDVLLRQQGQVQRMNMAYTY